MRLVKSVVAPNITNNYIKSARLVHFVGEDVFFIPPDEVIFSDKI